MGKTPAWKILRPLPTTFPLQVVVSALRDVKVSEVIGAGDQTISIAQMRELAGRSKLEFWLHAEWVNPEHLPDHGFPAVKLTAVQALELIGPVGLDEVLEKSAFSLRWRHIGWGGSERDLPSFPTTFPRWLIESGLGPEAVEKVLGGNSPDKAPDQPVSVDQIREIAKLSDFWSCLDGDVVRTYWWKEFSTASPRRLTAAEALELVGPIGLDHLTEKTMFSLYHHHVGWGADDPDLRDLNPLDPDR